MNSFEINKIVAAIIVTVIVVYGIGRISDLIYDKDSDVVAYKVEAPESSAIQASTESSADISALLALGAALVISMSCLISSMFISYSK